MGATASCFGSQSQKQMRKHAASRPTIKSKTLSPPEWSRAEVERDKWLHLVTGRTVQQGYLNSCCIYSQRGNKGYNQDSCIAWEDFLVQRDSVFLGVYDGHGPDGHRMSKQIRDSLCLRIFHEYAYLAFKLDASSSDPSYPADVNHYISSLFNPDMAPSGDSNSLNPQNFLELQNSPPDWNKKEKITNWTEIHKTAFEDMELEISLNPTYDNKISGSTAVTALILGEDLYVSCLGDSRAVIGIEKDGKLEAFQISEDHKCSHPKEKRRIEASKGRVFAMPNDPEVMRAWLPNDQLPGLAVSRAFGDVIMKPYGVSYVPDLFHRRISETDKFIVLGTDGIWDALTNQEAIEIIVNAPKFSDAAQHLVETAQAIWAKKLQGRTLDDCTAAVFFFNSEHLERPPTAIPLTTT